MAFVRKHGVVLMAAKGPVPRLTEWIAGEPIAGSWWSHVKGREIYSQLSKVSDSPNILTCRLIEGHVTFVHRRLWPALVRLAECFPRQAIAAIRDVHTPTGKHVTESTPFPTWVPPQVLVAGRRLEQQSACAALHMIPELQLRAYGAPSRAPSPRRPDPPGAAAKSVRARATPGAGKSELKSRRRRSQRRG